MIGKNIGKVNTNKIRKFAIEIRKSGIMFSFAVHASMVGCA